MTRPQAIDRLELAEVRLLRDARGGDDAALRDLLAPHLDGVWSIGVHHLGETDALLTVANLHERVRRGIAHFTLDEPFGVQLYRALWTQLDPPEPAATRSPTRPAADARKALDAADPGDRLRVLFLVATRLPVPRLAHALGTSEDALRSARHRLVHALLPAGRTAELDLASLVVGDLPADEAERLGRRLARSPALERARAATADALARLTAVIREPRAPRALLDGVHPGPAESAQEPAPPDRRPLQWLVLAAVLVIAAMLVLQWVGRGSSADPAALAELHERIATHPEAWLDPDDAATVDAALAHGRVPAHLRVLRPPRAPDLPLRGVRVLEGSTGGLAHVLDAAGGPPLVEQVRAGTRVPPGFAPAGRLGSVDVHTRVEDGVAMVAWTVNGRVHVLGSRRSLAALLDLAERRLAATR